MGDQQEKLDQISDSELFEEASAKEVPLVKEPPTGEKEPEQPETPSEEKAGKLAGRARDEKGRLLPKTEAEEPSEPEIARMAETAISEPEKETHRVPLTELLNERERRQNEQRQREALQQQLWQLQQQLQEKQTPQEKVDMFADPETWEQTLTQRNEQWRKQVMGEMSLRLASAKYPDVFQEAYSAMQQRLQSGDIALQQAFIASPDPGEMMVNWYKRERTIETVGQDPEAFLAKALDAALENPEFLARAVEKARGTASTNPTKVKLPPSLSKATASSASGESAGEDSDAAIWNDVWR